MLQKIELAGFTGNVLLTKGSKVEVFTAATGGTKLSFNGTDNKFANANLPKDPWVQGLTGSTKMRDRTLSLKLENMVMYLMQVEDYDNLKTCPARRFHKL